MTAASLRHVEYGLALLRGAGFGVEAAVSAFQVLVTFVVGHTLSSHAPAREEERSSPAYRDLDPLEFPSLLEAAAVLDERDLEQEFAFGLDVVLVRLGAKKS